jgi:hypothetical protein
VPFDESLFSLPESGALCPLSQVLERENLPDLEGFGDRLILPAGEFATRRAAEGRARTCWDPSFESDNDKYVALARSLYTRGMIRYGLTAERKVGLFRFRKMPSENSA